MIMKYDKMKAAEVWASGSETTSELLFSSSVLLIVELKRNEPAFGLTSIYTNY